MPKPPIIATVGLSVAFTLPLYSQNSKQQLQASAPRTIVVTEAQTPPIVHAGLLQSTLIMLPPEEKVTTVFGGDTVDWVFDGGHVASRFISIKPKIAGSTTDVHIVSDHGNEYTLQLREVSNDTDTHFDSKVFVVPGDAQGKDRLASLPEFVPATDLDKAKREAVEAQTKQANALREEKQHAEMARSEYPGQLHFDYVWDHKKGDRLGLEEVWRDDKFTYLRGKFQETPTLYELKDGKGSLINWDFANGLYTVPKTMVQGYLTIGKQRVDFHRSEERN